MKNAIPETHTLGSIDLRHFCIEIGSSSDALRYSLGGGSDNRPSQVLAHELTHWGDIVGTVWGQRYLDRLFLAFDAAVPNDPDEHKVHHIISFFDLHRKTLFPAYYKWMSPDARDATAENPWGQQISCGGFFDLEGRPTPSDPIFFIVFHDHWTRKKIIRQPITMASLLELRAYAAELSELETHLRTLDEGPRAIEETLARKRSLAEMYNKDLTTYTGAAHYLSKVIDTPDVAEVYRLGYALSDIVLNLQEHHIADFQHPDYFRSFGDDRLSGFISNFDRGYLFCCLSWAYSQSPAEAYEERVAEAMMSLGLPEIETVYRDLGELWGSPIGILGQEIQTELMSLRVSFAVNGAGMTHLRQREIGRPQIVQNYVDGGTELPLIITGDCEMIELNEHHISEADHDILYKTSTRLDYHTKNALRASRGHDFDIADYTY